MEEEDEEVSTPWIQRHRNNISEASLYRSIQSHLNAGSVQTLYQSVPNISLNNIGSMNTLNSMHSAISMEDIQQTHNDDTLTFNNDTNETIIDGSCTDLRNSKRSSRSVNLSL